MQSADWGVFSSQQLELIVTWAVSCVPALPASMTCCAVVDEDAAAFVQTGRARLQLLTIHLLHMQSADWVVFNTSQQLELMRVTCGGWHRPFTHCSPNPASLTFVHHQPRDHSTHVHRRESQHMQPHTDAHTGQHLNVFVFPVCTMCTSLASRLFRPCALL